MIDYNMVEEILLGYLRSSKQIKLSDYQVVEGDQNTYTITFTVDKEFGSTLVKSMDNPFMKFLEKNKTPPIEIIPHRHRGKP